MVGTSAISGGAVRPEQSGSVVDARIPYFRRGEYVKIVVSLLPHHVNFIQSSRLKFEINERVYHKPSFILS